MTDTNVLFLCVFNHRPRPPLRNKIVFGNSEPFDPEIQLSNTGDLYVVCRKYISTNKIGRD